MYRFKLACYVALLSNSLSLGCDSSDSDSTSNGPSNQSEKDSVTKTKTKTGTETGTETESNPNDESESDSVTDSADPSDMILHSPCAQETRIGGFDATVLTDYSGVQGDVANGVLPASITTKTLEIDECTLWQKHNLVCDPPCTVDETCDFGGTCIPTPLNQNLGTVVVEGLNKEITMEPREPGNNYFDTDVPHPLFDAKNDVIRLMTSTGFLGEITLLGVGSDGIVPQEKEWVITKGKDLVVNWNVPGVAPKTVIVVSLSVDQHGSSPANVECVFKDEGQGQVPAAMIDALLDQGITGFPSGRLTRETVDSVPVELNGEARCVDFSVKSYTKVDVSITGIIPCTGPGTCPDGLMCNPETFLCE